jgi:RimJ/RimL family protein N-acetyltransferase
MIAVRPFRPDEAATLKTIRLEALADSPPAFAERLDVALAMGGEDFTEVLSAGAVWGAFQGERCVAMAGLERHRGTNVEHKATVWGVYVAPSARGAGTAESLFHAIIGHARAVGVEVLELGVGDFNLRARRFYARMGFETYGLERRAVKLGERYIDEVLMALLLESSSEVQDAP